MKTKRIIKKRNTTRKIKDKKNRCGGTKTTTSSASRPTKSERSASKSKIIHYLDDMDPISDITDVDSSPASESELDDKVYYHDGLVVVRDMNNPGIKGTQMNLSYRTDPNNPTKAMIDGNPVDIRFRPEEGVPFTTGVLTESTAHTSKKPTGAVKVRDPNTGKKVYLNALQADNSYIVYSKKQKKDMEKALKKYYETNYPTIYGDNSRK